MFLAYIFPYPVGLFFCMLMIFLLRWLLGPIETMCGGYKVFFLYFSGRQPVWGSPSPFQNRTHPLEDPEGQRPSLLATSLAQRRTLLLLHLAPVAWLLVYPVT